MCLFVSLGALIVLKSFIEETLCIFLISINGSLSISLSGSILPVFPVLYSFLDHLAYMESVRLHYYFALLFQLLFVECAFCNDEAPDMLL